MGVRTSILVLSAALSAALITAPAGVCAQAPEAAITPFEGRRARAAQRAVRRAARNTFELAPRRRVRRVARREGVEGTGREGVSQLAEALDVDVVLQGEVEGRGRRARVTVVARTADGSEIGRETLDFPRTRATRRAFRESVDGLCVRAADAARAQNEPEPEPEELPPALEEEEPEPEAPREGPQDGLAVLAATVGVVGRSRSASIELADGGNRGYESFYSELRLAVEARPLANEPDAARGLYLRGAFAHSLGLGSQTEDGSVTVESTNFVRFDVDAGYLFWVDALEIGVGFGFGYDGYHLADNGILPTAEYLYLRPGARARIRLVDNAETLVLGIDAAYRAVLSRGAFSDSFGVDGDTHGLDLGASLGGNLFAAADVGFTWAVGVEYVGIFGSYAGLATDAAATSSAEHHIRLRAELGWSF